jgi:hypothetical protein
VQNSIDSQQPEKRIIGAVSMPIERNPKRIRKVPTKTIITPMSESPSEPALAGFEGPLVLLFSATVGDLVNLGNNGYKPTGVLISKAYLMPKSVGANKAEFALPKHAMTPQWATLIFTAISYSSFSAVVLVVAHTISFAVF